MTGDPDTFRALTPHGLARTYHVRAAYGEHAPLAASDISAHLNPFEYSLMKHKYGGVHRSTGKHDRV